MVPGVVSGIKAGLHMMVSETSLCYFELLHMFLAFITVFTIYIRTDRPGQTV